MITAQTLRTIWVTLAMTAFAQLLYAAPNEGIVAPTPEALDAKTYEVQLEYRGVQVFQGREAEQALGLQAGLGGGWEVGVEHRLGSPRDDWPSAGYRRWDIQYDPTVEGFDKLWFNVKKQVLTETKHRPALAVGRLSIGASGGGGNYAVVGKNLDRWQLYVGWCDVLDDEYWYEGVGYQYNEDWRVLWEHIGRGRFSTSLAAEVRVKPNVFVKFGYMEANNSVYDSDWLLSVTYRDSWK